MSVAINEAPAGVWPVTLEEDARPVGEPGGWWPPGLPHPDWCSREEHDDHHPGDFVCIGSARVTGLSARQSPGVVGPWLQVQVQQRLVEESPVVHVQAGELAQDERLLTLDEAEAHARALLAAVAEARGTGAGSWLPGEGAGVEWGVMLPGRDGQPSVDVRDGLEDARAAQDRRWGEDTRLVRREVRFGPWVPAGPVGVGTHGHDATTRGRFRGVESSAAPAPQGETL